MKTDYKIYVNGDSHTAGDGLADDETFPNLYTGPVPMGSTVVDRRWSDFRSEMLWNNNDLRVLYNKNNLKYVWSTKLGEYLGATVINRAVGGSCIASISTRTIADLELITSRADLPDYVLIGLTTSSRLGYYTKHVEDISHIHMWVRSAIPNFKYGGMDESYLKMFTHMWGTLSDEDFLIYFLKECLLIKNYVKNRIGRDPIFVNTCMQFSNYKVLAENSKNQWLRMLWYDLLEFDKINPSMMNQPSPEFTTGCGHYLKENHDLFAKILAKEHFGWGDIPVDKRFKL